jgi:hypothetical protein
MQILGSPAQIADGRVIDGDSSPDKGRLSGILAIVRSVALLVVVPKISMRSARGADGIAA